MAMASLYGDVSAAVAQSRRDLLWNSSLPADPDLTSIGIEQAHAIRENWVLEATFGIPPPHIRLCSPLTRALQTASITFDGTFDKLPTPVLIKEVSRSCHF
jgi:broad specificity phosphatase PhoE